MIQTTFLEAFASAIKAMKQVSKDLANDTLQRVAATINAAELTDKYTDVLQVGDCNYQLSEYKLPTGLKGLVCPKAVYHHSGADSVDYVWKSTDISAEIMTPGEFMAAVDMIYALFKKAPNFETDLGACVAPVLLGDVSDLADTPENDDGEIGETTYHVSGEVTGMLPSLNIPTYEDGFNGMPESEFNRRLSQYLVNQIRK
jgi:hypothetical protein